MAFSRKLLAEARSGGIVRAVRFAKATFLALLGLLPGCSRSGVPPSTVSAPSATRVSHVDPAGAARLIAEGKVVVIDVRTPKEYAIAHIKDARLIDFNASDFAQKLGELDRNQPYLVHCASGRRSTRSLEVFQRLGFKDVTHLDGGFSAWQAAGQPTVK